MALEMKPACEQCESPLDIMSDAYICSFECTYCPDCASELDGVCPTCGGELVPRPKRLGS